MATNAILTVRREDDRLFVQMTGQQQIEVFPESETEFFYRVVDARITFQAGSAGSVTSLTLHQAGRDMPARRLPD